MPSSGCHPQDTAPSYGGGHCLDLRGKSGLLPLVPRCREQKFSSTCKGEKYVLREEGGKLGVPIKGHQGAGITGDTPVT